MVYLFGGDKRGNNDYDLVGRHLVYDIAANTWGPAPTLAVPFHLRVRVLTSYDPSRHRLLLLMVDPV